MIIVLAISLVAAGVLLIIVAARMWSGEYHEANRRLATMMPYGVAPWTMPVPMAGFGIAFIGIGTVMLLPRELTSIGVAVLILGGIVGIGSYVWQPKWADPASQRRD